MILQREMKEFTDKDGKNIKYYAYYTEVEVSGKQVKVYLKVTDKQYKPLLNYGWED